MNAQLRERIAAKAPSYRQTVAGGPTGSEPQKMLFDLREATDLLEAAAKALAEAEADVRGERKLRQQMEASHAAARAGRG